MADAKRDTAMPPTPMGAADGSFHWGYSGEGLVAEWEGVLSLHATRDGSLLALHPAPGASPDLVEKTERGLATAFLRARRHQQSLHGSAVAYEGKALICVGASGLGKSTMADCLGRRPGVVVLGDDVTGVDVLPGGEVLVPPSESAVWLATDNSTQKAARKFALADRPARLSYIVALAFSDDRPGEITHHEIRGAEAVSALLPSVVRFETTALQWARELEFLGHLVSAARVVRLTRARDVAPDDVADSIFALLFGGSP